MKKLLDDCVWAVKFTAIGIAAIGFFLSLPIIAEIAPMPWEFFK